MAVNGFVHVTHPELGGDGVLVPDDESVVALYAARGWVLSPEVPAAFDPDAPNTGAPVEQVADAPVEQAPAAPVEAPKTPAPPVKDKSTAPSAVEKTGE